jgi:hypothetical protein
MCSNEPFIYTNQVNGDDISAITCIKISRNIMNHHATIIWRNFYAVGVPDRWENLIYSYIKKIVQPRGSQAQIKSNMPIPSDPDGTTFSHNIKEDGNAIRTNGERPRWITPYQKTSIYKSTPYQKTSIYKSNVQVSKVPNHSSQIKVQKIFIILWVKLGLTQLPLPQKQEEKLRWLFTYEWEWTHVKSCIPTRMFVFQHLVHKKLPIFYRYRWTAFVSTQCYSAISHCNLPTNNVIEQNEIM